MSGYSGREWRVDSERLLAEVTHDDAPEEFILCAEARILGSATELWLPSSTQLRLLAAFSVRDLNARDIDATQPWVSSGDVSCRAGRLLNLILERLVNAEPTQRKEGFERLRDAFSPSTNIPQNDVAGDSMFRSCLDVWRMLEWPLFCSSIQETRYYDRWDAWRRLMEFLVTLLELDKKLYEGKMLERWMERISPVRAMDAVLRVVPPDGIVDLRPYMRDLDPDALPLATTILLVEGNGDRRRSDDVDPDVDDARSECVSGRYCPEAVRLRSRLVALLMGARGLRAIHDVQAYFRTAWNFSLLARGREPHLLNRIAWTTVLDDRMSFDGTVTSYLMDESISRNSVERLAPAVPVRDHHLDNEHAVRILEYLVHDALLKYLESLPEPCSDDVIGEFSDDSGEFSDDQVYDSDADDCQVTEVVLAPASPPPVAATALERFLESADYSKLLAVLKHGSAVRRQWLAGALDELPPTPSTRHVTPPKRKMRAPTTPVTTPLKRKKTGKSIRRASTSRSMPAVEPFDIARLAGLKSDSTGVS